METLDTKMQAEAGYRREPGSGEKRKVSTQSPTLVGECVIKGLV
jgi:hypothetical protein